MQLNSANCHVMHVQRGLNSCLHICRDRLVIDPKEHPILFAEPTFNTKALREQMVQTVFEQHGCPAIFLAKNAVLSSFATGRQTSLVVDAGHEATVGEHHALFIQTMLTGCHPTVLVMSTTAGSMSSALRI